MYNPGPGVISRNISATGRKDASLDNYGFRGDSHAEFSNRIVAVPMLRRSVNGNYDLGNFSYFCQGPLNQVPDGCSKAQSYFLILTMTSSGEGPPLKLLALGEYDGTLCPAVSLTSRQNRWRWHSRTLGTTHDQRSHAQVDGRGERETEEGR